MVGWWFLDLVGMAKKNIVYRSKLKKARGQLETGRLEAAAALLAPLSRQFPAAMEVWWLLGIVAGKRGDYTAAVECLTQAAGIEPANAVVHYNLGIAYRNAGQAGAAIGSFRRALELEAGNAAAAECLGHACMTLGDYDQAIWAYERAAALTPGKAEVHANLGALHQFRGALSQAEVCYRRAMACGPDLDVACNLASLLVSQGRCADALDLYREALARLPGDFTLRSNYLLALNYLPSADPPEVHEEHLKINDCLGLPGWPALTTPDTAVSRRIRIGYVSADLREHSVAYFLEPLLEGHDRARFEVWVYSAVARPDAVTARLRAQVEHWVEITGLPPARVAQRIAGDGIDILVDLGGHTAHNSLPVFARKPAPVQVTYLGYPNTTGLRAMDYRLVDATVDPPGQDDVYSERLVRLPGCFLCYRGPGDAPPAAPLPAPETGRLTFGSFNNLAKINDNVIALWAATVRAVPGGRLLVKNPSLSDAPTRERYRRKFMEAGLAAADIELLGHTATRHAHLALYGQVDIALDTFPYNGTTTTCEALWMGVPVLTLAGGRHASRVGMSLLQAAGLDAWVARDGEEFLRLAREQAADLDALARLRAGLRERVAASPLCDSAGFVRGLEAVYRGWVRRDGGADPGCGSG